MKKNPCEHPLLKMKRLSKIQKLSHGDKMKRLRLWNACQRKKGGNDTKART